MSSEPGSGLTHGDYNVSWICALPLELTAALAMFDGRHPSLPQAMHDDNVYHLGRIGQHNVVMACLPAGQVGNNSAVTVAGQMRSSFPAIKFGLMVGIGGGAPSPENDIRLGDVVVSRPGKKDGGVIQFDFGRTITNGEFVRSGTLNAPPAILLNSVSALEARHRLHGHELAKFLSPFSSPFLQSRYTYQGWENDLLFEAEYDHVGTESTCERCDKSRLVSRSAKSTDPVIHYGTIASGNQVMRHGESRERLRKESNVLCFEMEAAGLMNNFPCIVIRGICDYADSHKSKRWQEYAAATAAAYAKELLLIVPSSMTSKLTANETFNAVKSQDIKPEYSQYLLSHIPYQRNLRFSGRKSILGSIDAHFEICGRQQAFILRGMGGIGKTQIALEYAYQCQDHDFDVFWVNCSTPQTFDSDFNQIQKIVRAEKENEKESDRVAVLRWLKYHKDWLLVFDNADDATVPYGDWIPQSNGVVSSCRVLFTTRDERLTHAVLSVQAEVPLMDDDEAFNLFKSGTTDLLEQSTRDDAEIPALVQRLANLPLAIALASAYLREYPWITIEQYMKQLGSFSERSKIFNYKRAFSNYNHSIMSTWEVSFARVQADNPEAADILTLLGFLQNGSVDFSFFKRVSTETKSKNLNFLRDTGALEQLFGLLRSLALLSFDGTSISLHPLVHEWIQARLQRGEVSNWGMKALCAVYYAYIASEYPHDGILPVSKSCQANISFACAAINGDSLLETDFPVESFLILLLAGLVKPKELFIDTEFLVDPRETLTVDSSSIFNQRHVPTIDPDLRPVIKQSLQPERPAIHKAFKESVIRRLKIFGRTDKPPSSKILKEPTSSVLLSLESISQQLIKTTISSTSSTADFYPIDHSKCLHGLHDRKQLDSFDSMTMKINIDPDIVPFARLCTRVALSLECLQNWWDMRSFFESTKQLPPAVIAESSLRLKTFLSHYDEIPSQDDEIAKIPPPILATLFLYLSAAAMNIGRRINIQVEKPIESLRVLLFQKASSLCQHVDTPSRPQLLLNSAISYARFVDQRSLTGPNHWVPVEAHLLASVANMLQDPSSSPSSILFDLFCQSMWESDHENALLVFCRHIDRIDSRISKKWVARLDARWTELSITEDKYTGFSESEKLLLAQLQLV